MAEGLGKALQKLLQRFESASDLKTRLTAGFFVYATVQTKMGAQPLVRHPKVNRQAFHLSLSYHNSTVIMCGVPMNE